MGMNNKFFGLEENIQTTKQQDAIPARYVIPARCTMTGEDFDIVLGYEEGKLTMLSGLKTAAAPNHYMPTAKSTELKTLELSNGVVAGRTYHCPICGNRGIVHCNTCHHITCYDGKGEFTCTYCGNSGQVSGTIQSVEVYRSNGLKQDGTKPQSGLMCYHGDK